MEQQQLKQLAKGHGSVILRIQNQERVLKASKNKIAQGKKNKPNQVLHSKFCEVLHREYRLASHLPQHDNLVKYYSFAQEREVLDGNYCAIELELIYGDMHERFVKQGGVGEAKLLESQFLKISEGLAHIHASGMAHNDIKPENIFIGKENQPKIGDFGCARIVRKADQEYLAEMREEWLKRNLVYAAPEIHDLISAQSMGGCANDRLDGQG